MGAGGIPYTNICTNTAMVVITNSIIVRSVNGYTNTLVNGNYPAYTTRVFLLNSTGIVVSGLTITNGFIVTNANYDVGAGIYMRGGLLSNCLITGNTISNPFNVALYGAGIAMDTGYVSHCVIEGNITTGALAWGTTLFVYGFGQGTGRTVSNCVIANNIATNSYASGAYLTYFSSATTITCCNVYGNIGGAGISLTGQNRAEYCVVSNNSYGITLFQRPTVSSCLIVNNNMYGIYAVSSGFILKDCTIANNYRWGIFVGSTAESSVRYAENCISYYNGGYYSAARTNNWSSTNVSYTNCCAFPAAPGLNNITNEPLFVDTNAANYRLLPISPCVNTGTNMSWMTNAVDLDGRMRIRYGTVDMGTYETIYNGSIYRIP